MILVNKLEKGLVLKYFPNTKFIRTNKSKSKRHKYYMVEEKDQLRFLSGMNKTVKDFNTGKINIIVPGSLIVNISAVKAFDVLLSNNIRYYKGELGGMKNDGNVLNEFEINKSQGLKRFCEYEMSELRKRYRHILKK